MTDAQLMHGDARVATCDDGRGPLETDLPTGTGGDPAPSSGLPVHLAVCEERDSVGGVHTHSPYATTFAAPGGSVPTSHPLLPVTGSGVPIALVMEYRTRIHSQTRAVGEPEVLPEEWTDRFTHTFAYSNAGAGR